RERAQPLPRSVPHPPIGMLVERNDPGRRMLKSACFQGMPFRLFLRDFVSGSTTWCKIVPEKNAERSAERFGSILGSESIFPLREDNWLQDVAVLATERGSRGRGQGSAGR